jgi:hypothetical protein
MTGSEVELSLHGVCFSGVRATHLKVDARLDSSLNLRLDQNFTDAIHESVSIGRYGISHIIL